MVRFLAILLGIVFIFAGVAGYGMMPQFVTNGLLFGYVEVDSMHNLLHVVTGVLAIMAATSRGLSKLFFILFGLFYGALAGVAIWHNGDVFGMLHTNMTENYLNAGMAVVALLIGLKASSK